MDWTLGLLGLFWGGISAVSLPLGAVLGLSTRPSRLLTSGLMAFGAGALLFALSIELFGHGLHIASDEHGRVEHPGLVLIAIAAAVLGGLLFQLLNRILNDRGGSRRKRALLRKQVARRKRRTAERLLHDISRVPLFRSLPPEEMVRMVQDAEVRSYAAGTVLFREGDEGDRLYSVLTGTVEIVRGESDGAEIHVADLGPGDVFGEIALISPGGRSATALVRSDARLVEIHREDFSRLMKGSPALQAAVGVLATDRLDELAGLREGPIEGSVEWERKALAGLSTVHMDTSEDELHASSEDHGAAMTIWLGIALDGIPESLVIGMLVVAAAAEGGSMSLAFIAGVFLANLPEALSSSVTMRNGGMSRTRVFWMWMSLCVLTAVGGFIGALIFPPDPQGGLLYLRFGIEGLAGGAMLTMIAETMLPEAFEHGGGPLVGLSTLAGFLAALAVKLLY